MRANAWPLAAILLSAMALPACALFGKSPPLAPRYFSPELESPSRRPAPQVRSEHRLRLGRIQSGAHLRQRMAYRTSEEEVGYYDEQRWTERPEAYLRRALSHSLFETRGISRATSGAAPTLEAELTSFEEIKNGQHRARVRVVISLDDAGTVALERTVTVEHDVPGSDVQDVVQALAHALSDAVEQISDAVVEHLAQMPSTDPPADSSTTSASPTVHE
jgi:ABC-type uncharacterized transport system auxiliary subunit